MEKRSFFNKLFKGKEPTRQTQSYQPLNYGGIYNSSWVGNIYENDTVRASIWSIANACGKLVPIHIRGDTRNPSPNIKKLLRQPNPYMTMQDFIIKMVIQREKYNNSFAYIDKEIDGTIKGIYPIPYNSIELVEDGAGEIYAKFTFRNGKSTAMPYIDLIHLRKHFDEDDLFGDSNIKTLNPIMETITTTDQGLVNAIRNGGVIRWVLKYKSALRPEDIKMQIDEFKKSYMGINNTGGIMATDPRYDAEQVKNSEYIPNASIMEKSKQRIHDFFGTNDKIIQSKYNEDEWNAFYENVIEPIAKQLSDCLTLKIFTCKELEFNNEIIFTSDSLQYASMKTKLGLVSMVDRSAMLPNEWRKVLNLSPLPGGNVAILRKDTGLATQETVKYEEQKGGEGNESISEDDKGS